MAKVENKRLVSYEFSKILNKILSIGKASVSVIINGSEVIISFYDKTRLFAIKFASTSTLENKDHSLHDFPLFTEHKLCSILQHRKFPDLSKALTLRMHQFRKIFS